jgi:hypothetical protein
VKELAERRIIKKSRKEKQPERRNKEKRNNPNGKKRNRVMT